MSKLVPLEKKNTDIRYPLTREQKEAIGLLSIGTFLEYFDLMLYIHMAVLLNDLFFPESDPHMKKLLSAFTFCITYLLRPIGALILGWIGDTVGRKTTVVITTFMMAVSCITVASLPTYAEIGITASCIMIACRIIQGMTSMGEIIGAELYLTETIKRPQQYSVVSLLSLLAALVGTFALGIASLATTYQFNWRTAFWIGALVALIGSVARTALRETPEFIDSKLRMKQISSTSTAKQNALNQNPTSAEQVNNTTALALFLIRCAWPACFYLAFFHCKDILIDNFGYTAEQVIHQNFFVAVVEMLGVLPLVYLGYYIYPILILKVRLVIFWIFILLYPYLLNNVRTPFDIFILQSLLMFFVPDLTPGQSILYTYFPVFKRFTYVGFMYAISRTIMYIITSFGLIYLTTQLGNYGLLIVMIPVMIGYTFGILHFEKLEIASGHYPTKKKWFLAMN